MTMIAVAARKAGTLDFVAKGMGSGFREGSGGPGN